MYNCITTDKKRDSDIVGQSLSPTQKASKSHIFISFIHSAEDTAQCEGLEFDIKYDILQDFRTSIPFKEKSSDHFNDLHKLNLLTNFYVNLTSSPRGVMN